MEARTQWVATVDNILSIFGHTSRVGERKYLAGQGISSIDDFWAVTKLRVAKVGYFTEDIIAYSVTHTQVRNFLTNRGEVLPASTFMFIKQSNPLVPLFDEVWLAEDRLPGSL